MDPCHSRQLDRPRGVLPVRHPPLNGADQAARPARTIALWILGLFLVFTGTAHLTFARAEFVAQVPQWLPLAVDLVVIASGVVELVLGLALLFLGRYRVLVGWLTAAFFVAIFPGNIEQFISGTDAFGLTSDLARGIRLLFQPLLVIWALWSTGAWRAWRARWVVSKS